MKSLLVEASHYAAHIMPLCLCGTALLNGVCTQHRPVRTVLFCSANRSLKRRGSVSSDKMVNNWISIHFDTSITSQFGWSRSGHQLVTRRPRSFIAYQCSLRIWDEPFRFASLKNVQNWMENELRSAWKKLFEGRKKCCPLRLNFFKFSWPSGLAECPVWSPNFPVSILHFFRLRLRTFFLLRSVLGRLSFVRAVQVWVLY